MGKEYSERGEFNPGRAGQSPPSTRQRDSFSHGSLVICAAVPMGAEAMTDSAIFLYVLLVASVLCMVATVILVVPMAAERLRRWKEDRHMRSIVQHRRETSTAVAEKRAEKLGSETSEQHNVLGWTQGNGSVLPDLESGTVPGPEKTVLIADDDPVVAFALSRRLQHMGFNVFRSPDAAHALMGAMKVHPDLVILDINMPSGNGLAVCEMMASDPKYAGIPVIIHTVTADAATKQRCERLGAYHVEKSRQSWTEIKKLVESLLGMGEPSPSQPVADMPDIPDMPDLLQKSFAETPVSEAFQPAAVPDSPTPPDIATEVEQPVVPVTTVQIPLKAPPALRTCGSSRVLCIESPQGRLELVDHQLSALGMVVNRTSDMEEVLGMCLAKKPHAMIIQAGADPDKLRIVLDNLTTHPVTRNIPILLINENDAVAETDLPSTDTVRLLKCPMDWEDLLSELEKITPLFDRQWNDPLAKTPNPTSGDAAKARLMPDTDELQMITPNEKQKLLKVLCIDDDPVIIRSIAIRLQPYGIQVKGADNGTQGYLLAVSEQPNLILLDLKMPNGEGTYVLGKLKDNSYTKNIPVIMLTIESTAGVRRKLMALGADGFLTKPVHWPELFAEMGHCVQLPKQLLSDYSLPEQLTIHEI